MNVQRPGPISPVKMYGAYKTDRSGQRNQHARRRPDRSFPGSAGHPALAREAAEPEVREALVSDLRNRLQNNTYHVDAKSVAKAMMQDLNLEKAGRSDLRCRNSMPNSAVAASAEHSGRRARLTLESSNCKL